MKVSVRAPGKAMVCGEYAVLRGAPGVVLAVNRYARASHDRATTTDPDVRTDELYRDGKKLGLGSSSASLVAAEAARRLAAGVSLSDLRVRDDLFRYCLLGHAARQGGRGSGADVAAAVFGGVLEVTRVEKRYPPVVAPSRLPGIEARLYWTGRPASTPELVGRVLAAAGSGDLWCPLEEQARAFADACQAGETAAAIAAARAYGDLLGALGGAAGVEIVTEPVAGLMRAAAAAGGAAKPSGAGGGDLAIALLPPEADVAAVDRAAAQLGLELLRGVSIDRDGVAADPGLQGGQRSHP